ncbi:MAG: hypothetical protein JXA54_03825 [Candidatus Heimdallarchaeota archaeon]|nr:hypothetical protein [Candidatus Heimdallarchaeota archaeon]
MLKKLGRFLEDYTDTKKILDTKSDEIKEFYVMLKEFHENYLINKKGESYSKLLEMDSSEFLNNSLELYNDIFDEESDLAIQKIILKRKDEFLKLLINQIANDYSKSNLSFKSFSILKDLKDEINDFISISINCLRTQNNYLRKTIAESMIKHDEMIAIPKLIKCMKKSKNWRIRDTAKQVIEKISIDKGYESIDDFIQIVERKYKEKAGIWIRYKGEILVGFIMGLFGLLSTLLAIFLGQ